MFSIPYSRYIIGRIPWYSFLVVTGAVLAILVACKEEKRLGLPKDTVIDLSIRILPFGIIGARLYYVIFSWSSYRNDPLSILYIWQGGLAIYGGIIAGLVVMLIFARKRRIRFFTLCDMIVPGLALAQAVGRWGNYFNMEAYGPLIENADLCFFPFGVLISENGQWNWHMATFFYESLADFLIFVFLLISRKKYFRNRGDIFLHYLFLYGAFRFCIESLRTDSLYSLTGSVRISQVLSEIIVMLILAHYYFSAASKKKVLNIIFFILSEFATCSALLVSFGFFSELSMAVGTTAFLLMLVSAFDIISLYNLFVCQKDKEAVYADDTV